MESLMYPAVDLDSTFEVLATDTWRRGVAYAREGRVLSCVWDPKLHRLLGAVSGSHDRVYTTTVQLSPVDADNWNVESGFCSCPMQRNCKHVAAIVVAATGVTKTRGQPKPPLPPPPAWRRSLDALLPPDPTNDRLGTPLAIELSLSMSGTS